MADVILTVRVKQDIQKTPASEVQPRKNKGDEDIEDTSNFYDQAKYVALPKSLKQLEKNTVGYIGSHISVWTGNSYYGSVFQGTQNLINMGKSIVTNPVLGSLSAITSLVTYLIDRSFTLKWENRDAEQAARRSGNYLTGNSR